MSFRLSSTTLTQAIECPALWYFENIDPDAKSQITSEAMAVGSIVHAYIEHKLKTGYWPTPSQLKAMPATYETPAEILARFPKADELARATLRGLNPDDYLPEGTKIPEQPLADFEIEAAGIPVFGTMDVWCPDARTIVDWKVRGNFKYAPKSGVDFRENVQLCYYAAAVHQFSPGPVSVRHVNLWRGGGHAPLVVEVTLDEWFLDAVWDEVCTKFVPSMKIWATKRRGEVPTTETRCYKYGVPGCPHMNYCVPFVGHKVKSERSTWQDFISLQAAPDVEPEDWWNKPAELLLKTATMKQGALQHGIHTLGDLEQFLQDHEITEIKGVGAKTAPKMLEMFENLKF